MCRSVNRLKHGLTLIRWNGAHIQKLMENFLRATKSDVVRAKRIKLRDADSLSPGLSFFQVLSNEFNEIPRQRNDPVYIIIVRLFWGQAVACVGCIVR